jgi:hypothetical protein
MSKKQWKPGDVVVVRVGGKDYETIFDENGVQRFRKNGVLTHLVKIRSIELNQIALMFGRGSFSQRDFAEFNMALGYSVSGFADLSHFKDMEIENPVWAE